MVRVTVWIIFFALPSCHAYGLEGSVRSTPPVPFSTSEACTPGPLVGTTGTVEGATVSVTTLLAPQKAARAFEDVEKDFAKNRLENAEKKLNTTLAIYPKSAVAWCLLGTLREKRLQLDEAFTDYSRALRIDSHLLPAYLALARIAFRGKRWQEVIQFTDQLVSIDSLGFPVAYLYNAAANLNLENLTVAEKSARMFQALDTEHERPQVYLLLGDILAREGDYAGAAEQKKTFLTIVPNAYDAEEIKEQVKFLEELRRRTVNDSVTASN
ncbi:MAG TPA: tetratricopeptide repeat protein [Acidobacteriaceae bacterium]